MSTNDPGQNKVAANITVNLNPAKAALTDFADTYKKTFQELSATSGLDKTVQSSLMGTQSAMTQLQKQVDTSKAWIQDLGGTLQMAIKNVENQAKAGVITLDQLQQKLLTIREAYAQVGAFNGPQGINNESAMLNALQRAEAQRTAVIQAEQKTRVQLEQQTQAQIDAAQTNSIETQLKSIKAFYDMKLATAEDSLTKIESLINQETDYFVANQDKRMQALKQAATYEDAINRQSASAMMAPGQHIGSGIGGGVGLLGMGSMMLEFSGLAALSNNLRDGLVNVSQAAAQLQQVSHGNIQTQQQLNQAVNDYIGIAEKYGSSIQQVMAAGTLWQRQYSQQVAEVLTSNSTLLSMVGKMDVTSANQAMESSLQAFQMKLGSVNDAMQSSLKLSDSWISVSHNFSVSTDQIAQGFERAAASAHLAGLNVDQLTALVAAGVNDKLAPCECKFTA